MARILIGGLVVAIIAALLFFLYAGSYRTRNQAQEQQITELNDQLIKLQTENEQLKAQLTKVQGEESTLAAQNEEMQKAIATFKATGKMPPTPPAVK
jgi:peptidoglycan hydrolase CwlO-like protein